MTDRASWWAKKLGQEQAPRPQQQPVYTQPPAQNQGWPGAQQPQQHQQPVDPNQRLSKEEFEAVMASGDPDRMGGQKTRALQNRLDRSGCPECGSANYAPSRGTATDHCYDCGWTTRFGPRSA